MAADRGVEAVVFDVNGVLVDSMGLHLGLNRELLAEVGVDLSDYRLARYRGLSSADFFRAVRANSTVDFDADALAERKLEAFAAAVEELPIMDGAAETVRTLAAQYAIGVASNDQRRAVSAVLRRLGMDDVVEGVVTIEDVTRGKPDPAVYEQAVDRLGVAPAAAVAIDDSAVGVEAAREAGLRVVGFLGSGDGDLPEATVTVERLPALPEAIAALD